VLFVILNFHRLFSRDATRRPCTPTRAVPSLEEPSTAPRSLLAGRHAPRGGGASLINPLLGRSATNAVRDGPRLLLPVHGGSSTALRLVVRLQLRQLLRRGRRPRFQKQESRHPAGPPQETSRRQRSGTAPHAEPQPGVRQAEDVSSPAGTGSTTEQVRDAADGPDLHHGAVRPPGPAAPGLRYQFFH
jgi:hypothetical protein